MKRRLPWLLVAGCLFIPAFPDPPLWSGAYVQHVTATSAVIAKIEPLPRALSLRVETAGGTAVRELPLSAPRRRHAFEVLGLGPGTEYRYALRDASGAAVDAGGFATSPARDDQDVRFAVVGDSGGTPWWIALQRNPLFYAVARFDLLAARATVSSIGRHLAAFEPHLWLHVGDLVYPEGEYRHYRLGFFRPFEDALRHAPCYPVIGNHDLRDDYGRQLLHNFQLADNAVTGDERFFTVAFGAVRFVGLDLPEVMGPNDPALRYLDSALEDAPEPWRVVFAHYPPYSAGRHRDRGDLIAHLLPRLHAHRVDVMFAGHDHNYQRFAPQAAPGNRLLLVVTGGGGKVLYGVQRHARAEVARSEYHFCRVTVAGARLSLEAVDVDGAVIDRCELRLADQVAARPDFDPAARVRDLRIEALL